MTDLKLEYDYEAAATMLAALRICPRERRLDTLAAVVKIFVDDRMAVRAGFDPDDVFAAARKAREGS